MLCLMDNAIHSLFIELFFLITITGVFESASNNCHENGTSRPSPLPLGQPDKNVFVHEPVSLNTHAIGRHVCRYERIVMKPHQEVQSYCKPTYLTYLRKCEGNSEEFCTEYRLVYELAHRSVQKMVPETEIFFTCCPGWSKIRLSAKNCKKAICIRECQNGGSCLKPNRCMCLPGWTGKFCQKDIDECHRRPTSCEQICVNWPGSYKCSCRDGFVLNPDGRTCKKTEADDPSEEISEWIQQYEKLSAKVAEIEKQLRMMDDLNLRVQVLTEDIEHLKNTTAEEQASESEDRSLGRINSLSQQMAIIEERLAECSCDSPVRSPLRPPPR